MTKNDRIKRLRVAIEAMYRDPVESARFAITTCLDELLLMQGVDGMEQSEERSQTEIVVAELAKLRAVVAQIAARLEQNSTPPRSAA